MTTQYERINNICLLILAATAVTVALIYTRSILIPFVIAFFLYAILSPIIEGLNRKLKWPRALVVILVTVIFIVCITLISIFIFNSLNGFFRDASQYKERIVEFISWARTTAEGFGYTISDISIEEYIKKLPFFSVAGNITIAAGTFLGNLLLVIIFVFFFLLGETVSETDDNQLIYHMKHSISRYVATKFLTSFVTGILVFILLVSFQVEMAFLFGVLTILFNFIPTIGSIAATVIPVPVMLLQFGFGWQLWIVLAVSMVIQFTVGNVVEPKLMGERMDLHPITVLLFLMFWGLVWGVPGMFLAVPITAVLRIVLSRIETTEAIAELMAGRIGGK
ncbi:MAG TPA: AI-2E family transporter [Syntrophales bacterium]|nr:AI-2E family transporter [Syntrophales bacterium]HPQ45446.1 AI-2E family transporter [Syntrophales bacterium]